MLNEVELCLWFIVIKRMFNDIAILDPQKLELELMYSALYVKDVATASSPNTSNNQLFIVYHLDKYSKVFYEHEYNNWARDHKSLFTVSIPELNQHFCKLSQVW
jgi:hypothetical protein